MLRECPVYLSSIRGQALVCVCGQRFERLGRNGCCWPVISQRLINLGNLSWCPLTAVAPKRLGNSLNAKPVTVELHIRHCRWRKSLIFRDGSGLHLQQHRVSQSATAVRTTHWLKRTEFYYIAKDSIIKQHDPHYKSNTFAEPKNVRNNWFEFKLPPLVLTAKLW